MREGDEADKQDLLHKADQIRVGLAGNLRDFLLINKEGYPAYGQDIDYNGQPAGYTLDPQENITYVSKHDNQTLWDNNQYRIAEYVTTSERVRMQNLGLATNMMAQGIPFFHMGSDVLRSKSMERDSYDSGDWFNAVDFTLEESTWARGLPRADKDGANWYLIKDAFANEATYTEKADRELAAQVFREFLSIRKSSPLFYLQTGLAVQQRVDFHNTGADQIPGVIAMSINDGMGLPDIDENVDAVMVVINASDVTQGIKVRNAYGFELHAIQKNSADAVVQKASFEDGEFRVPALSVAVFIAPQNGAQKFGMPVSKKDITQMPPLGKNTIHLMGTVTSWDDLNSSNQFKFAGDGVYAIELPLNKGFYKVKTGNNGDLEFGKLGAFLKPGSVAELAAPGGVMNLQIAEDGVYRFELDMSDLSAPVLSVIQK
jgi:pullulanase-type alpha-1,6-glucosidase